MNDRQKQIYDAAVKAVRELYDVKRDGLDPIRLLAVGGSSSEMAGGTIGHDSTFELGEALAQAVLDTAAELGFDVAFQCCEHLNRALVIERAAAEARGLEIVCVCPQPKAGGSLATAAYAAMKDPVVVERVQADAALDVGETLIGMHLRAVAIPIRLSVKQIGCARVTAARTRPRLIGGERARYAPYER